MIIENSKLRIREGFGVRFLFEKIQEHAAGKGEQERVLPKTREIFKGKGLTNCRKGSCAVREDPKAGLFREVQSSFSGFRAIDF
ncbi:MAG: hypothetical protein CO149_00175 [Nitrospirae bacterium CG_4_9_14_3_um_filter_51_5]|nr:MAG: hypothetical protein CO149_00175 [Nitrospirae bacterium CG_4_9_14_3_um_filter_51_5]